MDGQKEGRIDRKKLKDNYLRIVKGEFSQLCHEFEFPAKTSFANNSKAKHWRTLYNCLFCLEEEKGAKDT